MVVYQKGKHTTYLIGPIGFRRMREALREELGLDMAFNMLTRGGINFTVPAKTEVILISTYPDEDKITPSMGLSPGPADHYKPPGSFLVFWVMGTKSALLYRLYLDDYFYYEWAPEHLLFYSKGLVESDILRLTSWDDVTGEYGFMIRSAKLFGDYFEKKCQLRVYNPYDTDETVLGAELWARMTKP